MRKRQGTQPDIVRTAMTRIVPLAQRIALLLSLDYGEARVAQSGWRLRMEEVEPAIFLAERHLIAYANAVASVVLNDEERPIRDVEQEIRGADNSNSGLTFGELSARTSRNERTVKDALATLLVRGTITKRTRPDTSIEEYVLAGGLALKLAYFPTFGQPANAIPLFPG
jgi:hypothetical protein